MLSKSGKAIFTVAIVAAMFLMAGCPTQASIADINKDPGHYAGKDVTIQGTVSQGFSALGNGVFQIDDGTGHLWVYSQNFGVPGNGNKIAITGRVQQGFSFGGRNFGVILQQTEASR